jgi:RNA recognition motif-containing protein
LTFFLQSTGLSPSVDDRDFRQYFEAFGTITDCQIMLDHNTQRSRGFGFVTFDGPGPVDDIMQRRDHSIKGKEVRAGQTSLCVNVPAPGRFCGSRTRESARERHAPGVQRAIG